MVLQTARIGTVTLAVSEAFLEGADRVDSAWEVADHLLGSEASGLALGLARARKLVRFFTHAY